MIVRHDMETEQGYEGWANYETWAIALHISNEEPLYRFAVDFMSDFGHRKNPYRAFLRELNMSSSSVFGNRFTYGTPKADRDELDRFMRELIPE
jgi:hypothetical protein